MPTDEFKKLLDRDLSRVAIRPLSDISTPLLTEVVNFASWAFRRCETEDASRGNANEDIAAFMLFRHVIEMADAVQVLLAESCGTGAIPVVRSLFEASLGLSYLFESRSLYAGRSLSWLCANTHHSIEARKTLEPGTTKGREYLDVYEKEFAGVLSQPKNRAPNAPIAGEVAVLEATLRNPQFAPIEAEYQRLKTNGIRFPNWYSLFGGPKNVSDLAAALGRGAEYKLLYSDWSNVTHAGNMSRYLALSSGKPAYDALRRPQEIRQLALFSAVMTVRAIREMIGHFRNGEDLTTWYETEVRPKFLELANLKITFDPLIV